MVDVVEIYCWLLFYVCLIVCLLYKVRMVDGWMDIREKSK